MLGYQVYRLAHQNRHGGYGVPSICDHPDCNEKIDRGMAYCCGGEPFSDAGCGQYFCTDHLGYSTGDDAVQQCERCLSGVEPFPMKPDTQEWIDWQMTDESWAEWRSENPDFVRQHSKKGGQK